MKKIILLLILAISFTACKDNKSKQTQEPVTKTEPVVETKSDFVKITLNAVVPLDDTFVIQYTTQEDGGFKAKNKVFAKIKGSTASQDLVFNLPKEVFPTKFMLKPGTKNFKDVIINKVIINNDTDVFEFDNANFNKFFNPNKYIKYNTTTNTFVGEKKGNKYIPAFTSRPILIKRLKEKVY